MVSKIFLIVIFLRFSNAEDPFSLPTFSDCKHLILPQRCQCYHSGDQSQLRCQNIELKFLPKLPNNMRWFALDFSRNQVHQIDSYTFSEINVEKLILQLNQLEFIESTAFDRIENLKALYIDHNQLTQFDPEILDYPGASLEIFDISFNPLKTLELHQIFLKLPVLKQFFAKSCLLDNDSLEKLLATRIYLHQHLESIDLSFNRFSSLCDDYWSSFVNLRQLNLEQNQIHQIDSFSIRSLTSLYSLNLAHNVIDHLPKLYNPSLIYLNISFNQLQSFDDGFAAHMPKIRSIDFDSNFNLQTISKRSLCGMNVSNLEHLSFRFNNLSMIDSLEEVFCRSIENKLIKPFIDVNSNINLKCQCVLVVYQQFFVNYPELTCIQQGQDRYFISKLASSFAHCVPTICQHTSIKDLCLENQRNEDVSNRTCQKESTDPTTISFTSTMTHTTISSIQNTTILENNSSMHERVSLSSIGASPSTIDYCWLVSLFILWI